MTDVLAAPVPTTIHILLDRLAEAKHELDKLTRKAARYGNPDVGYTVGEAYQEVEKRRRFDGKVVEVLGPWRVPLTVVGAAPQVGPYEFLAKIEHTAEGNLLDIVPGRTVNPRFRCTKSSCEHCRTARQRNETFVLRNTETGEEVQVGRTCLKDFLGYCDPNQIAQRFAFFRDFAGAADEDDSWGFRGWGAIAPTNEVLALTSACIRLRGWASKGAAQAQDITPTSYHVSDVLWPPIDLNKDYNRDRKRLKEELERAVTDADWELAEKAIEWAAAGGAGTSDYGHNLKVLCSTRLTESKRLGFVCSAVQAYERAMDREVERAKARETTANSAFVGQVGERLRGLVLIQDMCRTISSSFGDMVLVKFHDEAGNVYSWFTANGTGFQNGMRLKVDGTVKGHKEFNGAKETQLNRCKLQAA